MPESVHPGVLSGQAVIDLLEDAKKKGKMRFYMDRFEGCLSSITADRQWRVWNRKTPCSPSMSSLHG
jgi:hypothetical protein